MTNRLENVESRQIDMLHMFTKFLQHTGIIPNIYTSNSCQRIEDSESSK